MVLEGGINPVGAKSIRDLFLFGVGVGLIVELDLWFGLGMKGTVFLARLLLDFGELFFLFGSGVFGFRDLGFGMHVFLREFLNFEEEVVLVLARLQSKTGKVLIVVRILPQSVLGKRT